MTRDAPCVILTFYGAEDAGHVTNYVQAARSLAGYGVAWVFMSAATAERFKLPRSGVYRTTDGRNFEYLARTLAKAHERFVRTTRSKA